MKQLKAKLFLFTLLLMFANVLLADQCLGNGLTRWSTHTQLPFDENDNTKGTVTDFDGNFTISVPSDGSSQCQLYWLQSKPSRFWADQHQYNFGGRFLPWMRLLLLDTLSHKLKRVTLTGSIASCSEDFENQIHS